MSDDKVAAAIMAAEASRQQVDLKRESGATGGYDIAGGIWTYYEHFLSKMQAATKKS